MSSKGILRRHAPFAFFLVACWTGCVGTGEAKDIMPDEQIQAKIYRTGEAFSRINDLKGVPEAFAELEGLLALSAANGKTTASDENLIQQIAYFRAHGQSERARLGTNMIIRFADFGGPIIVSALAPFIGTTDENVHKAIVDILRGVEDRRGSRPPDFSYYRDYIGRRRRERREVEQGFIEHIYRSSPGDALLVMSEAFLVDDMERPLAEQKPIRWAEHVVSANLWKQQYGFIGRNEVEPDARAQLDFLSKHPEWWARLYAAEIIRQHPEFGTDELVKRLADDPHPVVQKTAKMIRPSIRK
ncbi:MAG: hypothetical protein WD063_05950 [Pirellulales bacterium]